MDGLIIKVFKHQDQNGTTCPSDDLQFSLRDYLNILKNEFDMSKNDGWMNQIFVTGFFDEPSDSLK